MLEIGKLYVCENYSLLLYLEQHSAAYGKAFSNVAKSIPLLVLNVKEKYIEVLAAEQKGWIVNEKFLNIKEIK